MKSEKLYLEIINNISEGVYFVDTERCITLWNKAAENITGYKSEEIVGKNCNSNLLNHIDGRGTPLCQYECPLYATIIDGQYRQANVYLRKKEGTRISVTVKIFPMREENEIVGAIEIFTPNISTVYDENLVENLSHMVMSDALTGLASRRKTESYLEYRLHEIKRFSYMFCVVFFDIDDFRKFNNTYGHDVGDIVLINVSKSIRSNTREIDLIGRWGGEEFLGILEIKKKEEAIEIAEKIRILISNTEVSYKGEILSITASIGVTIANKNDTVESVTKRADALMYESKHKGKNCVTSDIEL